MSRTTQAWIDAAEARLTARLADGTVGVLIGAPKHGRWVLVRVGSGAHRRVPRSSIVALKVHGAEVDTA